MNEFDVEYRLDEGFLFILKFYKDFMNNLINRPEENSLAQAWLKKLCGEVVEGITAKRTRNTYLIKLLDCMRNKRLTYPFLEKPKQGALPNLKGSKIENNEPAWLQELVLKDNESAINAGEQKNCETYLAQKVLDNHRGACAYFAVSVADEGQIPNWIKQNDDGIFEQHLDKVFNRIVNKVDSPSDIKVNSFHQHIIDAISAELDGFASPGSNPNVEVMLRKFTKLMQNTSLGKRSKGLLGNDKRKFLLKHLKNQLMNGL